MNTQKTSVVDDCLGPLCHPEFPANRCSRTTVYLDIFPVRIINNFVFLRLRLYYYLCRPENPAGTKLSFFCKIADCCDRERLFETVRETRNSKKFRTPAGCSSCRISWPAVGRGGCGGVNLCAQGGTSFFCQARSSSGEGCAGGSAAGSAQNSSPAAVNAIAVASCATIYRQTQLHPRFSAVKFRFSLSTRASFCSQCLFKAATFFDVHANNFLCIPSFTL